MQIWQRIQRRYYFIFLVESWLSAKPTFPLKKVSAGKNQAIFDATMVLLDPDAQKLL